MAAAATDLARFDRVRALLERERTVPAGLLPPVIAASWRRCLELGLDPQAAPSIERLPEPEVLRRSRDAAEVLALARSEMTELSRQLGTGDFVLAFAAPDGMVLETLVAPSRRRDLEAMGIVPGAIWRETMLGTNALGTASATGSRITVRGPEHFFARHKRLTCIATPIFHPDRSLAGMLDASCPAERYAPRARAMVALAGASIETHLFRAQRAGSRIATFHGRPEFLETPYAGLLAIDAAGRIDAANDQARFMLVGLGEPVGMAFDALFAARADTLAPAMLCRLADRAGRDFHLRLDAPAPVRSGGRAASPASRHAAIDLVVQDKAVRATLDLAVRAARQGLPILLRGETGTGKDALAGAAHAAAGRAGRPVVVTAGGLPRDAAGTAALLAEAEGGTLLLDELDDVPASGQAALLHLLDQAALRQQDAGDRAAGILVVVTTCADPLAAIAAGRLRRDLYHRIAVAELTVPPLRERSDFAPLAEALLRRVAPTATIEASAIARLARAPWPGNVRELGNVLSRLALATTGRIGESDVAAALSPAHAAPPHRGAGACAVGAAATLRERRRQQIDAALRATGGNVSRAARQLGVSRNLIYRALAEARGAGA